MVDNGFMVLKAGNGGDRGEGGRVVASVGDREPGQGLGDFRARNPLMRSLMSKTLRPSD